MTGTPRILTLTTAMGSLFVIPFFACKQTETKPQSTSKLGGTHMSITLESQAITANKPVPRRYTGDGEDISPPLSWSNLPAGTKELALIMDDPDAPTAEPWVHWILYKIPADTNSLKEGIATSAKGPPPAGAMQGKNSWGKIGYGGPLPPKGHGVHHYFFKLYALDTTLDLKPGVDKKTLLSAMAGHILGEGELIGTYQR